MSIVVAGIGLNPRLPRFAVGTRVVMHVQNAVQTLADDIVYHFVDALHPCRVDIPVFVHVVIPCHGDADGPEACVLHHLQQCGLGDVVAPTGL